MLKITLPRRAFDDVARVLKGLRRIEQVWDEEAQKWLELTPRTGGPITLHGPCEDVLLVRGGPNSLDIEEER
jgi:hypothetical protein